jgi:hypothetical protein
VSFLFHPDLDWEVDFHFEGGRVHRQPLVFPVSGPPSVTLTAGGRVGRIVFCREGFVYEPHIPALPFTVRIGDVLTIADDVWGPLNKAWAEHIGFGLVKRPTVTKTGHACKRCKEFNEYAAANQADGTFVCFSCRI